MNWTCHYCGRPIDPTSPRTLQRITGWQRMAGVRASGKHGGSDILLREVREEFAHSSCVTLAKSGLLGQEALI